MAVRITCQECGYYSVYKTEASGEFHFAQHSCKKERARQARLRKARARRATIDRTPKPCLHKIARHQHGTRACAVLDGCHCLPCARANAAAEAHRKREIAYGRWHPYVDAQPTREHVEQLRAAGMGLKQIAKASGVAHGVLSKLIYGERGMAPSKRVRWETAVRLQVLQADLSNLGATTGVDGTGTRRRIQALVALGWSQSKVCGRLGMERGNFWRLMNHGERVRASTARAVAALYDELWDQTPPRAAHRDKIAYNRSRRFAAEREWAPPAAWADVDIDNPAAHPNATGYDNDRVEAVMAGALLDGDEDLELALSRADRLEVLRRGRVVHRWPTAETARQTGLSAAQLYSDIAAERARRSTSAAVRATRSEDVTPHLLEEAQTA